MRWSNYHTHSDYCDGKGTLKEFLESAKKHGVTSFGFSSHAPLPFPRKWCMQQGQLAGYLTEIEELKASTRGMEIYKGLEIDFIPGLISPRDFIRDLDYTIGSIHFVGSYGGIHWEIDNTLDVFKTGLERAFENNIRAAVTRYYELTREMIARTPPHIVGHIDKIKMHNRDQIFFEESEPWYREEIDKTLRDIQRVNAIVEVNTRGVYKKISPTPYPSPWVLERIHALRIPITLSSDAHTPDDIIREFSQTAAQLQEIGFKTLSVLKSGIWKQVPFNDYGLEP